MVGTGLGAEYMFIKGNQRDSPHPLKIVGSSVVTFPLKIPNESSVTFMCQLLFSYSFLFY